VPGKCITCYKHTLNTKYNTDVAVSNVEPKHSSALGVLNTRC